MGYVVLTHSIYIYTCLESLDYLSIDDILIENYFEYYAQINTSKYTNYILFF